MGFAGVSDGKTLSKSKTLAALPLRMMGVKSGASFLCVRERGDYPQDPLTSWPESAQNWAQSQKSQLWQLPRKGWLPGQDSNLQPFG
jgi:hypothetical protein